MNAYKADDPGNLTPREPMTRDEWIAYHVVRAPKITRQQWADTLLLLQQRASDEHDDGLDMKRAS